MNRSAFYLIVAAFTSIAIVCGSASARAQDGDAGQTVGFEDASGKMLYLHDFKGKAIIFNLWATWCGPCVMEMPSLAELQRDYKDKGLEVIAVSEDESINEPIAFYLKENITGLTPYFDKGHILMMALEARGLPTTLLIDRDGKMVQHIEGPVDWHLAETRRIIDSLVEQK